MDYVVAIPSAGRANIINNKTMMMLRSYGIDLGRVFVFVPESDFRDYRVKFYRTNINLIVGKEGIQAQREFISNFFEEGQLIVTLDDDITQLSKLIYNSRGKPGLEKVDCLEELILDMAQKLDEKKLSLAGVYPVNNPFFMKHTISDDLRFCIGQFRVFINRRVCERRKFCLLEDYETSIRYYLRDGGVLRYNNIVPQADYNILKWNKTMDDKKFEIEVFKNKYSKYVFTKKKTNDNLDIQFRQKIKNDVVSTLWIGDNVDEISTLSINSWLHNGYDVNLYIDEITRDKLPKHWQNRVTLYLASDIMKYDKREDILPLSDLWRYNLLVQKPSAVWLDADMVLLDRLPLQKEVIISSEHTFQSGAFKSNSPYKPNIGVLKFNKEHNDILKELVGKYKDHKEFEFTDLMTKFQNMLKSVRYKHLNNSVAPAEKYCPITWWNCDEIYYSDKYTKKYNVTPNENDWVLENSIGIHMWHNFTYNKHRIDFKCIKENSLYDRLNKLYN